MWSLDRNSQSRVGSVQALDKHVVLKRFLHFSDEIAMFTLSISNPCSRAHMLLLEGPDSFPFKMFDTIITPMKTLPWRSLNLQGPGKVEKGQPYGSFKSTNSMNILH